MNLEAIQEQLLRRGLDGWLFFDHHQRDPLAYRVLGFSPERPGILEEATGPSSSRLTRCLYPIGRGSPIVRLAPW